MKITKEIIRKEIMIIQSQISVARSGKNNTDKIIDTLELSKKSILFHSEGAEWYCDQICNNELPENSSGSYITALGDIDGLASALQIEDNEDLFNYANSILIF
jgi:hypothetical protein